MRTTSGGSASSGRGYVLPCAGLASVAAGMALVLTGACATPAAAVPPKTAHTVSAIVLVNRCAHLGAANAKLAEKAMNQLVEGCGAFSGGSSRFTATLLPGGAIRFDPRDDASATIPMCVVNHPLTHAVHLKASCALDVQLEESSIVVPNNGDAGR